MQVLTPAFFICKIQSVYLNFGFRGILKRIERVPLNLIRFTPT